MWGWMQPSGSTLGSTWRELYAQGPRCIVNLKHWVRHNKELQSVRFCLEGFSLGTKMVCWLMIGRIMRLRLPCTMTLIPSPQSLAACIHRRALPPPWLSWLCLPNVFKKLLAPREERQSQASITYTPNCGNIEHSLTMSSASTELTPAQLSSTPIYPPPKGVQSNFGDAENNNKPMYGVSSLFFAITICFFMNRIYTKSCIVRRFSWDDRRLHTYWVTRSLIWPPY